MFVSGRRLRVLLRHARDSVFPSQPATHTKELQSIQLSVCRGQSTLPVSSLTATREYRDKTWSSVLLRNVVKPEDFDNSTSDDAFCALPPVSAPPQHFSATCRGDPRAYTP